jgi:MSHA biogenesis protein MshE
MKDKKRMLERIRIGDLLLQKNKIIESQLQQAIEVQQRTGEQLGAVLVKLGFVDEMTLLNTLANQLNIPFVDIVHSPYVLALAERLPEMQARRFRAIILSEDAQGYRVGMVNPQDVLAVDALMRTLQRPLDIVLVQESALLQAFDRIYDRTADIKRYAEALSVEMGDDDVHFADLNTLDSNTDVPVVKLLQSLLEEALRLGASDIHIEPEKDSLRIRLRVDGLLQEKIIAESHIALALTQRLKLMAGLNITEKRLPQDGRFTIKTRKDNIDIRLSTLPVQQGESVVMRLLQSSVAEVPLDQLGMPIEMLQTLRQVVQRSHGMVLVTGPTGSGKTTTLYSLLTELNRPEKKIITVEDPVEYRIPRINQVQVNTKLDLDFARVLRSVLRQDPDIMMVGEIRDVESASIALRAAMTGHLVLATLHTNDAASSTLRLVDMGVEPYLVAAALRVVLSQRLLRKLCTHCRVDARLDVTEQTWLSVRFPEIQANFQHGTGCLHCQQTGYRGRVGVYELLLLTPAMLHAVRTENTAEFYQSIVADKKMKTLSMQAMSMAAAGITSIAEVIRVTETIDDVIAVEARHL